jgi:rhodanese-related sulfurtransferase
MDDFFNGFGLKSGEILHVSPRETLELCKKGAVLVDVREDYMNCFKMFDVDELIFCPLSILKETYKDLPKDKPLIFADAAGIRSKEAVLLLKSKGIEKKIANMAGGIVEWERDGLPLVIDKSERLTGSCMCMLRPRDKKIKSK